MSITGICSAAAVVGGAGLIIGILLSVAGKIFYVKQDEREVKIRSLLPGNNCGGCGYAGCDALAKAIANGESPAGACPVGGESTAVQIGEIMGTSAKVEKMVAYVHCAGDCEKATQRFEYVGNPSCTEAVYVSGGAKGCSYGCLGYGSCVKTCEFDAIHVVNGIAVVDSEKCVACGKCVETCPKKIIDLVPFSSKVVVQCMSKDKGKDVMPVCKAGCIGCKLCEKNCEVSAITVTDNIASIDYSKCTGCGECAKKCPKKIIQLSS